MDIQWVWRQFPCAAIKSRHRHLVVDTICIQLIGPLSNVNTSTPPSPPALLIRFAPHNLQLLNGVCVSVSDGAKTLICTRGVGPESQCSWWKHRQAATHTHISAVVHLVTPHHYLASLSYPPPPGTFSRRNNSSSVISRTDKSVQMLNCICFWSASISTTKVIWNAYDGALEYPHPISITPLGAATPWGDVCETM